MPHNSKYILYGEICWQHSGASLSLRLVWLDSVVPLLQSAKLSIDKSAYRSACWHLSVWVTVVQKKALFCLLLMVGVVKTNLAVSQIKYLPNTMWVHKKCAKCIHSEKCMKMQWKKFKRTNRDMQMGHSSKLTVTVLLIQKRWNNCFCQWLYLCGI